MKDIHTGIQAMEFISMDLIGKISPPSAQGHQYTLTVICMLTGFTFCIPLKTKNAEEIVETYLKYVICTFRASRKILSNNRTELKNKIFKEVTEKNQKKILQSSLQASSKW